MGETGSRTALKAGMGYTVGNILIKGINFLSIPLFSRLLTTEEFGVYNVFISYDAILYVVIGLALHSSVRSAKYEFEGEIDDYTSSISLIPWINLGILFLVAYFGGNYIAGWMGFNRIAIFLLIFYSFGSATLTLYNNRISLDYAYKKYLLAALVNSVGNIGFSLLLIFTFFSDERDMGRIVGSTVTIFALGLVLLLMMYRKARPRYNKVYWKFAIKYSLPIVPHGISQVVLAQIDRIMIQKMVGSAEAGIYSLAGNIKLILTVITDSIATAWSTWFYEKMEENRFKDIQVRAKQLVLLFTVLAVGLIAISPELIWILGGKAYVESRYVAIPMIMDAFILFLYNVIIPSEYYVNKTIYIMLGTMAAAVINVVANYFGILNFGFIAAAYTTLFAYVCYLIFHCAISRHMIKKFVLPIRYMLFHIIVVAAMGAWSLIYADSIVHRYLMCAAVVALYGLYFLYTNRREMKGANDQEQ